MKDIDALIRPDAVHRSVYTDPQIFELEMERIFGRTWVYLGHLSEIPQPGDYKTTRLGRHPVIVARVSKGEVTGLINRCRHRGSTVCQQEFGNAKFFRCAYHGWSYANSGKLVGIPHPGGYGESLVREELGLVLVPRVAQYRGFVFGSMAAEGPGLKEHLGGAAALLDEFADVSPTGEIEVFRGLQRCAYDGNWKLQVENGVDPYHVEFLHRSTFTSEALRLYKESSGGRVLDMDGHGVTDHRDAGPMPRNGAPPGGFNLVVFPNLVILRTQIRTIQPIAVDRTEVYTNAVRLQQVSDELNLYRLRTQEFEFGPTGVVFADDLEIFERVHRGLQSGAVDWVLFSRGLEREKLYNGHPSGAMMDEAQHRGMYRHWKALMAA